MGFKRTKWMKKLLPIWLFSTASIIYHQGIQNPAIMTVSASSHSYAKHSQGAAQVCPKSFIDILVEPAMELDTHFYCSKSCFKKVILLWYSWCCWWGKDEPLNQELSFTKVNHFFSLSNTLSTFLIKRQQIHSVLLDSDGVLSKSIN